MKLTPTDFLEMMEEEPGQEKIIRFGRVDASHTTGNPQIVFDGTETPSTKKYVHLSSYSPAANDRVFVMNNVVMGKIGDYAGGVSGDYAPAVHNHDSSYVKKIGDTMTGKLIVPEFELKDFEITRMYESPSFANGVANEKFDIEMAGSFAGTIEITVMSTYANANAAGSIRKVIHAGFNNSGAPYAHETYYADVATTTADHFAISDLIWDAGKGKHVIKIVHRTTSGNPVRVIVKARGMNIEAIRNIAFSPIYTTDTTVYAKPVRS